MATRRLELFVDDVTGKEIPPGEHRTTTLEVDGVRVTIDMSPETAKKFDKAMKPWLSSGTKVTAPVRQRRTGSRRTVPRSQYLAAVREFARSEGYEISDRGRIPGKVMEAYEAKHSR